MNQSSQDFSGKLVRPPWLYKQWMIAGNPACFFDRLVSDYGDFIHYRGLFNFYLINHPALVKQVLMDTHESFDKNSIIYNRFSNAFGDGLVVSEGEKWKRQRKLMQPMFGHAAVNNYFQMMIGASSTLADQWEESCRNHKVFDLADQMNHLTLEIAGRAFFHDGFTQNSDDISQWTQIINHYSAKPPLPIVTRPWFPSPTNLKLRTALKGFHGFLQEMIDSRRNTTQHNDLLSLLLQAKHEDSGTPMNDTEIREEVLGMIIGGHETSSAALTWIFYELHQNPEVQQKLFDEIDQVIGNRPLTMEDVPKLKYTKMVIDETLRMHPPFWFENRNTINEVELGGTRLPKGAMIAFSRYSLHRHENFWEAPNKFNPLRFEPDNEENRRSSYAYIPFGGGPRTCIGIHFAVLELVVILATISQRFQVIVDESDYHQMAAHLTMTPKYGLKVRLQSR
ncbi:MAG: hypothetical protein COA78_06585 [Blastopirellula sp.]|nr:MAG: hypothetical protein COA78_06585 [Blastopirellula sp.]